MIKSSLSQSEEDNIMQLSRNYEVVSIRRNNRLKHFQKKRVREGHVD